MSREHHKNLKRGLKQSLTERSQRVRASRHNNPHKRRVHFTELVQVEAGTPGAIRSIETAANGELVVVHKARVARTKWVPVTEPFPQKVASGSTATYGMKNDTRNMAPKGKSGAKPK